MARLIMLKGLGVQGKSHIVQELLKLHPDWIHLKQTNREFFKLHPDKMDSQEEIANYYYSYLDSLEIESDKTYITERSPIDYACHMAVRKNLKMEEIGDEYLQKCLTKEKEFINRFQMIDIFVLENLDLRWLGEYFTNLPKDDVHKKFYTSRGVFITLQDRWRKAYERLSSGLDPVIRDLIQMWHFPEDNDRATQIINKWVGGNP